MIVLDSSMTLSWFFEDERTEAGLALLLRIPSTGALVPSLWKVEVANALATAVRRGRCTPDLVEATLSRLERMRIRIDDATTVHAWGATRALAAAHGLTIYDATYLEVAVRGRLPLATCDRRLAAAGHACGLAVVDGTRSPG
ncbi:type II toxin-antitoxin system VapC family toxin [Salinarimonas chemoclinalis]|uniref:type II toxin-antitoxin system VapC family toxin n=1 Tax=Salinarimonas chemoclinalis TaxID=3241599 RepID=UPI0035591EB2